MDTTHSWFADNRANWDDRAALHEASGYGISELVTDRSLITPEVAQDSERLGDLRGARVIHLQCHLGTDTISLHRLGAAQVVGLDLSAESLRRARDIAARAGAEEIDFVQANVYDARSVLSGEFDVVYTSLGVLCWLPDVAEWARVVASLLRPGGRFVIRDDHPMFLTIGDDVEDGLRVEQPYFQQQSPMTWDDDGSYVGDVAGASPIINTTNHQWNHSIGEIITAVLGAGLVVDSFEETPYSAWCRWPELMVQEEGRFHLREDPDRVPLQFVMTAHLPSAESDGY